MSGPANLGMMVLMCLGLWLAAVAALGVLLRKRLRTVILIVLASPLAVWGVYILAGLILWPEPPQERVYSIVGGSAFVAISIFLGWWAMRSWSKPQQADRPKGT